MYFKIFSLSSIETNLACMFHDSFPVHPQISYVQVQMYYDCDLRNKITILAQPVKTSFILHLKRLQTLTAGQHDYLHTV